MDWTEVDKDELTFILERTYANGHFPMAKGRHGPIEWFTADPRGILPLRVEDGLHVPKRLQRTIAQKPFELTCDQAFVEVMRGCARPDYPDGSVWINEDLIDFFEGLHRAGLAHSIEAWRTDPRTDERHLVGGIYGISMGAVFFAESMFHAPQPRLPDGSRHPLDGTDASKVCLVTLIRHLDACGFTLLDTQMTTDHVARFGGYGIEAEAFDVLLKAALAQPDRWRPPTL
jgi:leucyl/phenylalanyl-tRNA--protein transferase